MVHPPIPPLALAHALAPPYAQASHSPHIHAILLSKPPPQIVVTSVMLVICSPRF